MKSPEYIPNSSTPQAKFKKLSESDLYHSGFFSASSQHEKKTFKRQNFYALTSSIPPLMMFV